MPNFDLVISADPATSTAQFRLRDEAGNQLAFRETDFSTLSLSQQQGLFDLRNFLRGYVARGQEAASVAEVGVCIAEKVLGEKIFLELWTPQSQRTLRVQLPGASEEKNPLAAMLARVPWEIARPSADKPSLRDRNLLVRVVHEMKPPETEPLALGRDETLRVLFVFAEARGSRPLAARKERRALLRLFEHEIYPKRKVEAHFLTHGVTRERLESQIQDQGGYHVVHWSGHGHLNLLELAKPGGAEDHLSGDELLELFTRTGGFIPRLFFLSACHSGDILRVRDWNDFIAVAQGREAGTKHAADDTKEISLTLEPGYTGTAHALLKGGVPSVVAMRYAVGDEYTRELAVEFYRALLAHAKPKSVAAALTMGQQALLDPDRDDVEHYDVCDHATPVLYGEDQAGLSVTQGRSSALDTRDPRLHQIAELTTASHEHFVGRTWELAGLGSDFVGSSAGSEVKPVAVITGLGGMGKTALVAEALALWERRFDWVLLYQAKPNVLGFYATLGDIHKKLNAELGRYYEHVKRHPADAIHRPADADFTGEERQTRLTRNLVRAMKDEAILLVLDNFETNLQERSEPGTTGEPVWASQDPAWDRCLSKLAAGLNDTASRVLITSRRPLAALAQVCHRVSLGPLPAGEAALYLREHAGLSEMFFSGDDAERALTMRLLDASRFHPLLMDRLARLATGGPALRPQLMQALATLETSKDYKQLPELFATERGDEKELAYLNDALEASIDQLIAGASPDARLLLWTIAVANDPVTLDLLEDVWSGKDSPRQAQIRQIKQQLEILPSLPKALQEKLKAIPPGPRAMIETLSPERPNRPDPTPLLRYLVAVGLVTQEGAELEDENPDLACHELVRERIRAWMREHEQDRAEWTENEIRLMYADRLATVFDALKHENLTLALEAGSRALDYCAQAGAYAWMGDFASGVVTSTSNSQVLDGFLPHLDAAVQSVPEGPQRWVALWVFADALALSGRPGTSLSFYEQAASQTRAAVEVDGENRKAWEDISGITGNWANALHAVGKLDAAHERLIESAEAAKRAGLPAIEGVMSEMKALQINFLQGKVEQVSQEINARLAQIETWWQKYRSGHVPLEAPDPETLSRAIIAAREIATDVDWANEDWETALLRNDANLEVMQELQRPAEHIAIARFNRAKALRKLGRFIEARADLETCLQVFENDPANRAKVHSALAGLFDEQGDARQAIIQQRRALTILEQVPDPSDRATAHGNLAVYLNRAGMSAETAEAPHHQLAALIYRLVAELGQHLQTSLHNYAAEFRRARAKGRTPAIPRVAELLADPAFNPLAVWLRQRQVDTADLQTAVDQFLEHARQAALGEE